MGAAARSAEHPQRHRGGWGGQFSCEGRGEGDSGRSMRQRRPLPEGERASEGFREVRAGWESGRRRGESAEPAAEGPSFSKVNPSFLRLSVASACVSGHTVAKSRPPADGRGGRWDGKCTEA
jgi:hypothetical protein